MISQSAGEKFAKMTPINSVYWSYFCINRINMLIVILKSLEPLKFFKTISGFSWPRSIKPYLKSTLNISWDCLFKRVGGWGDFIFFHIHRKNESPECSNSSRRDFVNLGVAPLRPIFSYSALIRHGAQNVHRSPPPSKKILPHMCS
jgi:hypothetical protein